ncbi:MAG TPA: hypothetical protein DC024_04385 [Clostridiales bacterium]|nr:hypothetical protein [Clostridiales bacterium]
MNVNVELLTEMGISLTQLAVKGTVTAINSKIKTIKIEKDVEKVKTKYDELINELLAEREEAIRIAQVYKSEIEKYEISDSDIVHLNNTVSRVLELVKTFDPNLDASLFENIRGLINADTLKAMQLLGFNYKAAIGDPLTELCANAILSKSPARKSNTNRPKK